MRQLQACDFCDGDPVGVFEPLPDRLAADQPRVALCGDCRDTLERVLAPLDADAEPPTQRDDTTADHSTDAESSTAEREAASAPADATDDGVTIDPATVAEESDGDGDGDEASDGDATTGKRASGGDPADRPPGYANVLRLVRNRDESLPRDELEAVASSAYDMPAADVQRAVDAAIENGDLREADGEIRPA